MAEAAGDAQLGCRLWSAGRSRTWFSTRPRGEEIGQRSSSPKMAHTRKLHGSEIARLARRHRKITTPSPGR
jgi:hypothetical protein